MMRRVGAPGADRAPVPHRRDRVRGAETPPERARKRTSRAALTALAVSVVSVVVAVVAVYLSVTRPPDVATPPPVPLMPKTVTVTLLAPR